MKIGTVNFLIALLPWLSAAAHDSSRVRYTDTPFVQFTNTPAPWRQPILTALAYYPEITHTRIKFRVKHARSPLTTNLDWLAFLFHFGRQAYIVTISDRTIPALSPILFDSLDEGAKLGVIGHELSHVSNFSRRNFFGWVSLGVGHLSSRYLDRMEFATDSLCIAHGLGYALLDWSIFVRHALSKGNWRGAANVEEKKKGRERYMNPETIIARLKE
jgi:hypothetical protein